MRVRAALLTGLFLLLSACGGGSSKKVSCDSDYWDGTVGTCLPDTWQVLDAETLRSRGVPEETIVAFQRKEPVSGQFPTVAVTREPLADPVDPLQYSEANIRSVEVLEGYVQVDSKDFTTDGVKVKIHTFTAQPIEGEPMRRFYQVSTSLGDSGYTFTAVTPVSIEKDLESEVLLMLKGMTLKAPAKKE